MLVCEGFWDHDGCCEEILWKLSSSSSKEIVQYYY